MCIVGWKAKAIGQSMVTLRRRSLNESITANSQTGSCRNTLAQLWSQNSMHRMMILLRRKLLPSFRSNRCQIRAWPCLQHQTCPLVSFSVCRKLLTQLLTLSNHLAIRSYYENNETSLFAYTEETERFDHTLAASAADLAKWRLALNVHCSDCESLL